LGINKAVNGLYQDEVAQYLRLCISGEDYPFTLPQNPVYLSQLLANDFLGGKDPRIGDKYIAILAVDSYPDYSMPGIMRIVETIPFPFRFTINAACIDEYEAHKLLNMISHKWELVSRPFTHWLLSKKPEGVKPDPNATEMHEEAFEAASKAQRGIEHYVRYTAKLVILDSDLRTLYEKADLARRILQRGGFGARHETYNGSAGWLSSLPGHGSIERRIVTVSTSNLVHTMPLSAPFLGIPENQSQFLPTGTPPLFYARTVGNTPFRLHLHHGSVGHTAVVGPTGYGKTTWMLLCIAQWFRLHPKARCYVFYKAMTAYALVKAMGGQYYKLTPDDRTLRLCPLFDLKLKPDHITPETPSDFSWAAQYIELLCGLNGLILNAE
jgi:type IV secretion system protein TrbE